MTPEQVATAIELALYRVADRLKNMSAHNKPTGLSELATALREVGYELASIRAGHEKAKAD
jgi:hypothetical protein